MRVDQIPFKDYLVVNGERLFVWSIVLIGDIVKLKLENGSLLQITVETQIQ